MPYRIEERDGKYCVVKETDGETIHCHETREQAEAQMRALYANVDDAAQKSMFYVPFSKVDHEQHMVWGVATDELPDVENDIVDYEATKRAVAEWAKWRNIREMHSPSAVGVAEEIILDDATKSLRIGVKVVDDGAWAKVKAGVYKGFSIGGKVMRAMTQKATEGDQWVRRIVDYALTEISLVDRPANPRAVFTLIKREGGNAMKEKRMKKVDNAEEVLDEVQETIDEVNEAVEQIQEEIDAVQEAVDEAQEQAADATEPQSADDAPADESPPSDGDEWEAKTRRLVMAILEEVGLLPADLTLAANVGKLRKRLAITPTNDDLKKLDGNLRKVVGDLAKVVAAIDALEERLDIIQKMAAGQGPVLREIMPWEVSRQDEAMLKTMLADESLDQRVRDEVGRRLAEMQIKAAQRRTITFG